MNAEIAILILSVVLIVMSVIWMLSLTKFTDNPDDYTIIEVHSAFTTWYVAMFRGKPILPRSERFMHSRQQAELFISKIMFTAANKEVNNIFSYNEE